ncbi:uncharacterized protein LOC130935889 [Arachis stenosperma]|uniref:uncharacterized protein LOC130935889 n=1 Tax=Arachis stenosperma TaxID=217475 RepID=UPI0025ACADD5|nr:uncharacterized protein LOC130935889 [Arachis stenosperma]XP_057721784.1 uncharacterized protein LOC130935889 [Arachis stenosperma]
MEIGKKGDRVQSSPPRRYSVVVAPHHHRRREPRGEREMRMRERERERGSCCHLHRREGVAVSFAPNSSRTVSVHEAAKSCRVACTAASCPRIYRQSIEGEDARGSDGRGSIVDVRSVAAMPFPTADPSLLMEIPSPSCCITAAAIGFAGRGARTGVREQVGCRHGCHCRRRKKPRRCSVPYFSLSTG